MCQRNLDIFFYYYNVQKDIFKAVDIYLYVPFLARCLSRGIYVPIDGMHNL